MVNNDQDIARIIQNPLVYDSDDLEIVQSTSNIQQAMPYSSIKNYVFSNNRNSTTRVTYTGIWWMRIIRSMAKIVR